MKLRVFPIAATVVVSSLLLFGGWYTYRQMAIKEPLNKIVQEYDGVNSAHFNINHNTITLKLDLDPNTNLGDLVQYVRDDGKSLIGGKTLKIDVENHSSANLDKWWSDALFPIAEAMENRKYTEITSTLEKMEKEHPGLKATAELDETNVYISLTEGKSSKFMILPRTADELGVWNNA